MTDTIGTLGAGAAAPLAAAGGVSALLDTLGRRLAEEPPGAPTIRLRSLVAAMQADAGPVLTLLFAFLLVSPLSAVPGATTLFGLTIASILGQGLLGRGRIWLPAALLERNLPVRGTEAAIRRLRGPVGWVERRLRRRQRWVFAAPLQNAPTIVVLLAALCAPLMEVIPGSGTSVGAAIALFSAGQIARDGVVVLLGAGLAAVLPVTLWLLLT
jgi:hypothetical protein